jgi:hypothetical protein
MTKEYKDFFDGGEYYYIDFKDQNIYSYVFEKTSIMDCMNATIGNAFESYGEAKEFGYNAVDIANIIKDNTYDS